MSRLRPLVAGTLVAAAGLIGINAIAYAATGGNLILGHSNAANRVTKLVRTTRGPALALKVKSHQAPFTVNSTKQVAKLNASYVGGLSARSLQTRGIEYTLPASTTPIATATYLLGGLPAGTYFASFNVLGQMSASGDQLDCVLERTDFAERLLGYGSNFLSFSVTSASGVVIITSGHPLQLRCFTDTGSYRLTTNRSIVDFVKLAGVTTRTSATAVVPHSQGTAARSATGR